MIDCGAVLVRRMSVTKRVPMPSACAVAGMSSALSCALLSFGFGVSGATRLTFTGTFFGGGLSSVPVFAAPCVRFMVSVACDEPMSSCDASMVTVISAPAGGRLPLDGETVIHGLSLLMLKESVELMPVLPSALRPSRWMICVIRHGGAAHGSCAKL